MANDQVSPFRKAAEDAAREILYPDGKPLEGYGEADVSEVAAIIIRHHEAASQTVAPGLSAQHLAEMKYRDWYTWRAKTLPDDSIQPARWEDLAPAEQQRKTEEAQWYLNVLAAPPAVSTPRLLRAIQPFIEHEGERDYWEQWGGECWEELRAAYKAVIQLPPAATAVSTSPDNISGLTKTLWRDGTVDFKDCAELEDFIRKYLRDGDAG